MDNRDVQVLFQYMEQLVAGVQRIADEIEIANSNQVVCVEHADNFNFDSISFVSEMEPK